MLVYAINNNVKYLSYIHKENAVELKITREKNSALTKWNDQL